MKRLFSILFLVALVATTFAQLPTTAKVKVLNTVQPNGMTTAINPSYADTLKSADTLFYKIPINHGLVGFPYISQLFRKTAGADTSVITVTFWQSVDGVHNWVPVKAGASPSAYSVSLTKAIQKVGQIEIDFWQNIVWFQSSYLGVRYVATTVSGFKGVYYGSIRFNSGK
jgi:hypothetical protein